MNTVFHLALNVSSLDVARTFYTGKLGCNEGRSTESWVDFDFFGHQLSLHLGPLLNTENTGKVGEHRVPMPHFGLVMSLPQWQDLADKLKASEIPFVIEPTIRFEGEPGEQYTMFFLDPFGNPIEVKAFPDPAKVYSH